MLFLYFENFAKILHLLINRDVMYESIKFVLGKGGPNGWKTVFEIQFNKLINPAVPNRIQGINVLTQSINTNYVFWTMLCQQ